MRQELFASAGFYNPTFLKMFVDTELSTEEILYGRCEDKVKLDKASAAFFHEYIHYLQDISTTYGLMNISIVVDYIKYINKKQIQNDKREFDIPVKIVEDNADNTYLNLKLRSFYVGDSHKESFKVKVTNIEKRTASFDLNGELKDINYIVITYFDAANTEKEYRFGSMSICESMAFLMENFVYEGVLSAPPYFPYNTAVEVVNFIYPILNSHPLLVSALCEASLMFFNPGAFFYDTLIAMKEQNFEPTNYSEIFDFCYSKIKFNYNGIESVDHLLLKMSSEASIQLGGYFTSDIFGDNTKWVSSTLSNALDIRIQTTSFITDIAIMGQIQKNIFLQATINKVGAPLFINNNGDVEFMSPLSLKNEIRPGYLWAIQQVFDLYTGASKKKNSSCELLSWCNKSAAESGIAEFTSHECFNSPWEKVDHQKLCMFAQIWKTWGMHNEKPIPR